MRLALIFRGFLMLLIVTGCDSPWRSRFPIGTKLYDQNSHQFFGKVVAYEDHHNFQNGTEPGPSVLIEQSDAEHTQVWGSCATCASTFQVVPPDGK